MTDLFALARACGAHVGHSTIGGDPKNRRVHYSFDHDQLAAFAERIAQAQKEPTQHLGDEGILDGTNRTTGGWIGQP